MGDSSAEANLAAARRTAEAYGYSGLNFREVGTQVGVKAASIDYHFASKADLEAAVAKRYLKDASKEFEARSASGDREKVLHDYSVLFRKALQTDNRICLSSFMAAEYDDLPDAVKIDMQTFDDVNVASLTNMLSATADSRSKREKRARSIFAAVAGAQLMARSRADISLSEELIDRFREFSLLPK